MRVLLISLLFTLAAKVCFAEEVVLIANINVAEDTLDAAIVERIFLGKKSYWNDQTRIVPVMLKAGPAHDAFASKVLNRSVSSFTTYWKHAIFTGKGIPPRSFATEAKLVEFVADTPGAVGYVSSGTKCGEAKLIVLK